MWINVRNETASPAGPDSVHRKPSLLLCAPSPIHIFLSHQAGWQKQLLTLVVTAQTGPALPSRPRKGTEVSADSCHHQEPLWNLEDRIYFQFTSAALAVPGMRSPGLNLLLIESSLQSICFNLSTPPQSSLRGRPHLAGT
ncbi:unnamed protein product [Rangifer tarandus platyrhynchus]|uniref:Uncharacterized protein n=1 Tax=Rangifer tarandus platyrhynchus TaxID=3082113 RepID=A0AC59YGQ4_RANTA